jgi:hypothetical protein
MVRKTSLVLGSALIALGILGFAAPRAFGANLTPMHNGLHLLFGAVAIATALRGSVGLAKGVSLALAAFFLISGLLGFVTAEPVVPMMETDPRLLVIFPDRLQFGTTDHFIHFVLGVGFMLGAVFSAAPKQPTPEP